MWQIFLVGCIVIGATLGIFKLLQLAQKSPFAISGLPFINIQSKYQSMLLGLALLSLLLLYVINPSQLLAFLAIGNPAATATAVPMLGIESESWLMLGSSLTVSITLFTTLFVYLQFRQLKTPLQKLVPYLPYVLIFSFSNALSEEIIYRLGVIVPLVGSVEPAQIMRISAILFGLPHLRGMPNGIVGALMAGILGWLLTKSVLETNGIFWAWSIHFLQDVVIFSGLVLGQLKTNK